MSERPGSDGTVHAMTNSAPLWHPSPRAAAATQLMALCAELHACGLTPASVSDSHALWQWSVDHPAAFWEAVWHFVGMRAAVRADGRQYDEVLVGGNRMAPPTEQGPRWFTGTRFNAARQLLEAGADDHRALVAYTELGHARTLTYRELRLAVAQCAAAMRAVGVATGDRVAGWLPNGPEAVIAMLATASIGAIWSSCSPDFGTNGVLDRFGQIEPTLLLVAPSYTYAGKAITLTDRIGDVVDALPSVRAVWVVPDPSHDDAQTAQSVHALRSLATDTRDIVAFNGALHAHASVSRVEYALLPFDHPLYILYSSGTTGLPKCIVHGAGGTLLQHLKELRLHVDLRDTDTIFYFTTCGWMMWNWLVSSLAIGATVVLYDGSPLPAHDLGILWRIAAQERISVFGTSAKYLSALEKTGVKPRDTHALDALRTILSTGSPLDGHSYDFVYRDISPTVQLASISGGTDIVSCFALGDPTAPVYRGELQMRGLGMAVDVFDEQGRPVRGRAGELVCTTPFPSMPVAFWNDPDGTAYARAYFEHFPNVWRHGDWAEITAHDGVIIYGRSDATLNPGGVRIGTAEIYRVVDAMPELLESVVTEYTPTGPAGTESQIVLFVRLQPGHALTEELSTRIRRHIREAASPHHVPRIVRAVRDIPRTRSGKTTELAVREAIHGRPVRNIEALANPESLEEYRSFSHI